MGREELRAENRGDVWTTQQADRRCFRLLYSGGLGGVERRRGREGERTRRETEGRQREGQNGTQNWP
ncbi:hypothetical protein GLAREA_03776 [Glarea lozoyensis ATCC 20868]|uniref:Uncharacterized protein n=1 Tax=Glarea lozoyensis (strain ATCC 20868 / MF5171) TaxID=1116229 RepID=S3D0Z5_GLAL2|nr:uncharacterized protein GLAREA_03776 [Glarea lozoyensis ATCC 20868]EPE30809.1 hypothetical protein GLAREA_03776 [Glarea lozoyensis ATCC 20868]